ncbi:hypothetical protein WS72_19310 [Burkholderia savannae]|uniref:Uncharacterized protein n=1 Tax=Burkholderia savannae TaxID=1637837 RepID=A0ABR5T891_9BURK|nr:hypothetical protein WS72_19310 [Burkholderia savannae]
MMEAAVTVNTNDDIEVLMLEYAQLYRRTRVVRGYVDMNLDQVVAYAVIDMRNSLKLSGDPLALLRDEVAFQKECLERLEAANNTQVSTVAKHRVTITEVVRYTVDLAEEDSELAGWRAERMLLEQGGAAFSIVVAERTADVQSINA